MSADRPDALSVLAAQNRHLQAVFAAIEQACVSSGWGWAELGVLPRGGVIPEEDWILTEVLNHLVSRGLLETHEFRGRRFWRVRR